MFVYDSRRLFWWGIETVLGVVGRRREEGDSRLVDIIYAVCQGGGGWCGGRRGGDFFDHASCDRAIAVEQNLYAVACHVKGDGFARSQPHLAYLYDFQPRTSNPHMSNPCSLSPPFVVSLTFHGQPIPVIAWLYRGINLVVSLLF